MDNLWFLFKIFKDISSYEDMAIYTGVFSVLGVAAFIFDLTVKYFEKEEEKEICSICQESTGNVIKLECTHFVHLSCLSKWLTPQTTCPLCRKEIVLNKVDSKLFVISKKINFLRAEMKDQYFSQKKD